MALATNAFAADSIGFGIRGGSAINKSSYYTEAFADYYLNKIVSVGATVAYVAVDYSKLSTVKRDTSVPITLLAKAHAPIPFVQPYVGVGEAVVFHGTRGTKGTPVALAGASASLGPIFVNLEYRRQFDDKLDFLGGGVGIKF